ncbi:MAG: FAD-dependent oxidoreductase [Gammaproteobacteria bacterium]|nr:FAD-dependent oxidoreductase [Gammaproteobacteria bacterium]
MTEHAGLAPDHGSGQAAAHTPAHYDVLVIGGGIHGAGVAQAAAAAGYSVLVVEQGEVASGTSSRSSKLIHGGLRYLEHGQYSLVRECLQERALLLRLAPDLVQLRPFFIPVYADSSRSRFRVWAGLSLYALLGGGGADTCFRSLPRREWSALDGLKRDGLRAVFQYWDAQTDDVQLTRAVMASAQKLGARLQTQTTFCSAIRPPAATTTTTSPVADHWQVQTRCARTHTETTCTAHSIVNAAGPWVNEVLARVLPAIAAVDIALVQGTHLVLAGEASHGIYYLESPRDGRPVFVMPWHCAAEPATTGVSQHSHSSLRSAILLGTTETGFSGDPATVRPLAAEREYLLETYRHYFGDDAFGGDAFGHALADDKGDPAGQTPPVVLDAFAGLRVLPAGGDAQQGGHAARPRETLLQPDRPGSPRLVSVYGGKLTTYRSTAHKVLQLLAASLPRRAPLADTRCLPLERVVD